MILWIILAKEPACRRSGVLPDASIGLNTGTLARSPERSEGSRCKPCLPAGREGMARVFAVQVQILLSITRVAVQVVSEPEICHGAGI
jgi:hypothetical protein